jgi:hypothetical protein
MNTRLKLRLVAAAVIVNGALALSIMAPRPALANPCAPINSCTGTNCTLAFCNLLAPSGCTATSATCTGGLPCSAVHGLVNINCQFN